MQEDKSRHDRGVTHDACPRCGMQQSGLARGQSCGPQYEAAKDHRQNANDDRDIRNIRKQSISIAKQACMLKEFESGIGVNQIREINEKKR